MENSSVTLSRDCEATQIPAGSQRTLAAGTSVDITQTLGGSFTVSVAGAGLFRIASRDADALGIESGVPPASAAADGPLDEKMVWDALKTCFDPEIPVNIVDLGLIYDLQISPHAEGGNTVSVKMTLTAPGCGMGPAIAGDAQQKLLALPGVRDAMVDVVWEPQWHHSMISEAGRKVLGLD